MAFRVGECIVHVRLEASVVRAEWHPAMPKHMTKRDWKQYRRGRSAFTDHLLRQLKGTGASLMVEL
jgi:hypothetical protein